MLTLKTPLQLQYYIKSLKLLPVLKDKAVTAPRVECEKVTNSSS